MLAVAIGPLEEEGLTEGTGACAGIARGIFGACLDACAGVVGKTFDSAGWGGTAGKFLSV